MATLAPLVTLVDPDGYVVPTTECAYDPEPDPADAASWPAWTDNWYFEPTDAAELLELEAERVADMVDAPRPGIGEMLWTQMMVEGSLPSISGGAPDEPFTPSDEDWADYLAWTTEVERRDAAERDENARHPLYGNE